MNDIPAIRSGICTTAIDVLHKSVFVILDSQPLDIADAMNRGPITGVSLANDVQHFVPHQWSRSTLAYSSGAWPRIEIDQDCLFACGF